MTGGSFAPDRGQETEDGGDELCQIMIYNDVKSNR